MALSLLCGGLGVASAANGTVHVAESSASSDPAVYTTEKVNILLDGKADKTALDSKANETEVVKNTENIATNKANITALQSELGKKADKSTVTTALEGKANKADVYSKTEADDRYATKDALDNKADQTYVDTEVGKKANKATTLAGYEITDAYTKEKTDELLNTKANAADVYTRGDINTKLADVYSKTEVDGKITREENARNIAIQTAINGEAENRKNAIDAAIAKEVADRNQAIKIEVDKEANARDTAIANAKNDLQTKITEEKTAREAAIDELKKKDTALEGKINTLDASSVKYDNATVKDKITLGLGGAGGTKITNLKDADLSDSSTDAVTGKQLNKTNEDLKREAQTRNDMDTLLSNRADALEKNTGGITRNDAKNETYIEKNVTVDNQGNVTANGKLTAGDAELKNTEVKGTLGVTGATTLSGELTAKENATFEQDVTVKGTTNLKNTTVTGDLKVTGTITTDKMIFGEAPNNYTEIDKGKVTSKNLLVVTGTAETISSSSTFDAEKNEVGFANSITGEQSSHKQTSDVITDTVKNNNTGDQSFHKQTSDVIMDNVKDGKNSNNRTQTKTETKDIITDEKDNSSTTSQTASQNKTYLTDKDRKNTNSTIDTAKGYDKTIKGENGKTSTKQDELNITNTAKDGTITNDAKNIVNNAATMDTTVTGKATESYGELETTVNGKETHNVTGTKTENVTGKVTENYNGGQETNVTGNQDIHVTKNQTNKIDGDQVNIIGGSQTTTATDINRNASSGMIDTVENASGSNKETKVAGQTTTDVKLASGEEGQYIRGATESRDYLLNGTLKNSETKTAEATSSEVTDGTNKASTIQDAKNLAGSVTNGTETGISGIHANKDGSVSIDSTVVGGGMSSVINQKKDSIQSAVGDGTNSTVIHQDKDNVTIASSNGTVGIVGKDIVNNAQNTITNTAGTKITDTAGDSTVTTENGKGTTFTKTGSTAYREGGPTDTNISGNTITTGKVTMDYAEVMKDLGVHGNAKVDQNLEVDGTSTLKGDVTMENNATVGNNLTVNGTTKTKTLSVTENATVGGTLDVTGKATFKDSVSIEKDLTVGGDVTAKSYKVGDKTYISADGINANNQKITNVADGSISEGSKDAVNGGQLYGVKRDLEHQVDKVGANAAAMANLRPMEFDPSSKWNIAAAIGNYGSETAAALGAFYRPNDNVMVNLSTAFGTGENMVGGGVSVRLGKGGNKLSREETNALKAQVADLTARMDALLSVLNPNMSKDFPDVPENHWAYEAVSRLAGNDIVQGYPDGEFHGERTMTRYEMAEIIYNALSRGAEAERELVEEFKPELQAMAASEKSTAEKAEG